MLCWIGRILCALFFGKWIVCDDTKTRINHVNTLDMHAATHSPLEHSTGLTIADWCVCLCAWVGVDNNCVTTTNILYTYAYAYAFTHRHTTYNNSVVCLHWPVSIVNQNHKNYTRATHIFRCEKSYFSMCHEHMCGMNFSHHPPLIPHSSPPVHQLHVHQCWPNHTSIFHTYTHIIHNLICTINHKMVWKIACSSSRRQQQQSPLNLNAPGCLNFGTVNKSYLCRFQHGHSFELLFTECCKPKSASSQSSKFKETNHTDCLHWQSRWSSLA